MVSGIFFLFSCSLYQFLFFWIIASFRWFSSQTVTHKFMRITLLRCFRFWIPIYQRLKVWIKALWRVTPLKCFIIELRNETLDWTIYVWMCYFQLLLILWCVYISVNSSPYFSKIKYETLFNIVLLCWISIHYGTFFYLYSFYWDYLPH